jgi:hypothetical protein
MGADAIHETPEDPRLQPCRGPASQIEAVKAPEKIFVIIYFLLECLQPSRDEGCRGHGKKSAVRAFAAAEGDMDIKAWGFHVLCGGLSRELFTQLAFGSIYSSIRGPDEPQLWTSPNVNSR